METLVDKGLGIIKQKNYTISVILPSITSLNESKSINNSADFKHELITCTVKLESTSI